MSNVFGTKLHYALWEVTQKCNLSCIHCRADASPQKREMKLIKGKAFRKLINELVLLGKPTLVLTGGEPLLRKDIVDLVEYATRRGIATRIQSNGLLLTDQLAEQLKEAGIISFGIGLDGSSAKIHDKVRNLKGAFKSALKAINTLKSHGIKVHVEFTITKLNLKDLSKTLDLLESLNVDTFLARAAIFSGRASINNELFRVSSEEYKMFLSQLSSERRKRKLILNCQDPLYHLADPDIRKKLSKYGDTHSGNIISGCTVGINMVHIHSNGDVGLCTFLQNVIIGNITKRDLSLIWRERQDFPEVRRLVSREYDSDCKVCPDRFICGGCRARALLIKNNLFGHDPYCWKYQKVSN